MDIVVWRAAALLLTYPDQRFYDRRPMLRAAVADLQPTPATRPLATFLDHVDRTGPVRLAVQYMEMRRCSSLHLTYYREHDDERRLAARTRLADLYRAADWGPADDEEPDFLPVVLEYAALCADEWLLLEHREALERLQAGLLARRTPYASLVEAVCATLPRARPHLNAEANARPRLNAGAGASADAEKGHGLGPPPEDGDLAMTLETWGSSA